MHNLTRVDEVMLNHSREKNEGTPRSVEGVGEHATNVILGLTQGRDGAGEHRATIIDGMEGEKQQGIVCDPTAVARIVVLIHKVKVHNSQHNKLLNRRNR